MYKMLILEYITQDYIIEGWKIITNFLYFQMKIVTSNNMVTGVCTHGKGLPFYHFVTKVRTHIKFICIQKMIHIPDY